MSDAQDQPESRQSRLSRSLGSLWANHTGGKSSAVKTTLEDHRVRCTVDDAEGVSLDTRKYRDEAMAAIYSITGRRVYGFIAKHDQKTDVSTGTFILERPRQRN